MTLPPLQLSWPAALSTLMFGFATTNLATGQAVTFRFQPSFAALGGSPLTGASVSVLGGFLPVRQQEASQG